MRDNRILEYFGSIISEGNNEMITIKEFLDKYRWPPSSTFRKYLLHKKSNGFLKAFSKRAGKNYVNPSKFFIIAKELYLDEKIFPDNTGRLGLGTPMPKSKWRQEQLTKRKQHEKT